MYLLFLLGLFPGRELDFARGSFGKHQFTNIDTSTDCLADICADGITGFYLVLVLNIPAERNVSIGILSGMRETRRTS